VDGDVFNGAEANTEVPLQARYGESTGVIERGMSEERRTGTWEALLLHREVSGGRTCQRTRRMSDGRQGVGSAHSTLRTGKPATWGRG
jgi:hypothetical protein